MKTLKCVLSFAMLLFANLMAIAAGGPNVASPGVKIGNALSAEEVKGYFRSASGDGYLSFVSQDANLQCGSANTEATIKASTSYTNRYTICLNSHYIHLGLTAHFSGNVSITQNSSPYIYKVEDPTVQTIRAHRVQSLSEIYNGGYYVIMGYAKMDSQWYMMSSENIFNKYPGLAGLLYSATDPGESIEFAAYAEHGPIWEFVTTPSDEEILATGISLNQTSLTLTSAGQTTTLTATVTPSNATNKSVTWSSSDTNVATVSSTGVVTAVTNGTATITATTADGTNLSATCDVFVSCSTPIDGESVTITVSPSTGQCLRWGSSAVSGAGSYYNTWKSTDTAPQLTLSTPANDMWIHTDNSSVHYYGSKTFTMTVPAEYAITGYSFDFVGYEGNSNSYTTRREMTVTDEDGNNYDCTAITAGRVEVTNIKRTSTEFTISGSGNVLVTNFKVTIDRNESSSTTVVATGVTLSQTRLTLTSVGQTATLTATVTPSNAANKSVTWSSSDTNVATVSSTGVVTAVANGTTTITATTADGTNLSATCDVTVNTSIEGYCPVSRVSAIETGKEYMIYNSAWSAGSYSDRWGFVYDNDKIAIYGRSVPESFVASSSTYLWTFEDAGNGKYYVKNVGTGRYAGTGTTMSTTLVAYTIANFVDCPNKNVAGSRSDDGTRIDVGNITTADNLFYIYNGEKYWNGDDYWMWTNPGHDGFTTWSSAHPYAIYEVQSVGGEDLPVLATGISLNQTSLTLTNAGQTATLTATVTPSTATNKSVTWSSSDESVATVSSEGVVTAVANGTATITATTADGTNLSASCTVAVSIATSSEKVSVSSVALNPGGTVAVPIECEFTSEAITAYQFDLYLPEGVSLAKNDKGRFAAGVTYILSDRHDEHTASLKENEGFVRFAVSQNDKYTLSPGSGTLITVYLQSDESVSGELQGSIRNFIMSETDQTKHSLADCTFIMTGSSTTVAATGVTLNQTILTLTGAGQTSTLTATVTPSNATNKSVTWSSSDESVATVSSEGVVTAVANGTATITATTADGTNLSASCEVTVEIEHTQGIPGDVNGDTKVNGADIVAVINYVLAASTASVADVNGDTKVNGADIVAVINYVLSFDGARAYYGANVSNIGETGKTNVGTLTATGYKDVIEVALQNDERYTAFQFVLTLPNGGTLTDIIPNDARISRHQFLFREIGDGRYFVLGFENTNSTIAGNEGTLLWLDVNQAEPGIATITDILFFTQDAVTRELKSIEVDLSTGVSGICSAEDAGDIYDMNGRIVMRSREYESHAGRLPSGVYIRNGHKFIVKQ